MRSFLGLWMSGEGHQEQNYEKMQCPLPWICVEPCRSLLELKSRYGLRTTVQLFGVCHCIISYVSCSCSPTKEYSFSLVSEVMTVSIFVNFSGDYVVYN